MLGEVRTLSQTVRSYERFVLEPIRESHFVDTYGVFREEDRFSAVSFAMAGRLCLVSLDFFNSTLPILGGHAGMAGHKYWQRLNQFGRFKVPSFRRGHPYTNLS